MREEREKSAIAEAEDVSDALAGGARTLCIPQEAADAIIEAYIEQQADPDTADFPAFMRRYGRRSGEDIITEVSSLDGDDRLTAETEILIDIMTSLAGIGRTPEAYEEEASENAGFFLAEDERKEDERRETLLDAGMYPGVMDILLSAVSEDEALALAKRNITRMTEVIGMSRHQIDILRQMREWTRPGESPETDAFDRKTASLILSAVGSKQPE